MSRGLGKLSVPVSMPSQITSLLKFIVLINYLPIISDKLKFNFCKYIKYVNLVHELPLRGWKRAEERKGFSRGVPGLAARKTRICVNVWKSQSGSWWIGL